MKQLLDIADEFGTGLSLFNALRRAWPRDPGLDTGTYQSLLGWVTSFIGRSLKAGSTLNGLSQDAIIDNSLIPVNNYLRHSFDNPCNTFVRVHYYSTDNETGDLFENVGNFFIEQQGTKQGFLQAVTARINNDLSYIAASNNRDQMYQIVPGSISIQAAVNVC